MKNLNTGFYNDLDTNFELALEMSEKEFSHSDLILMLKNGNIPEKQIAALKLDDVYNQEEAKILISNLTGCDGKIREAVALRINQILTEAPTKSELFNYPEIFANASIDINGNICRLVIDSVRIISSCSQEFSNTYLKYILEFISESFKELDNFIFRDKKYVINKQLFKLYWCLEALKLFAKQIQIETLLPIIERTAKEREYTIREKAAQIIALTNNPNFSQIKEQLLNDENYYVRNALNTTN